MTARIDRLATFLAALLCLLVGGLEIVDRSGWLRRMAEDSLGRQVAEAGGKLRIGDVHWRWLRPSLDLSELRLSDADGREVGFAERVIVHVDLRVGRPWLAGVSIDRSKLVLSQGLYDLAENTRSRDGSEATRPAQDWRERLSNAPPVLVRQLEIESLGPDAVAANDLGTADLWLAPSNDPEKRATLGGLVRPVAGTGRTPQALQLSGALDPAGPGSADDAIVCSLSGTRLPLDDLSRLFPGLHALGLQGFADLSGQLRLPLGPTGQPEGQLDWRTESFSTDPLLGDMAIEDASLDARVEFSPRAGDGLYAHEAWAVRFEGDGRLGETPWRLEALGGRWAGERRSLDLAVRLDPLDLGTLRPLPDVEAESTYQAPDWLAALENTLPAAAQNPLDQTLTALGLAGPVGLDVGWQIRKSSEEFTLRGSSEIAAFLRPQAGTSLTYQGWLERSGRRFGYPIRADLIGGTAAFAIQLDRPEHWELHLAALQGTKQNAIPEEPSAIDEDSAVVPRPLAEIRCEGRIAGPREARRDERALVDLDLDLRLADVQLNDSTIQPLKHLYLGLDVGAELSPTGGYANANVRLVRKAPRPGLQPWVDVSWDAATGRERRTGLAFHSDRGRLAARWNEPCWNDETWPMPDPHPELKTGDFGVQLQATGQFPEADGTGWALRLLTRTEGGIREPESTAKSPRVTDLEFELADLPLDNPLLPAAMERLTGNEQQQLKDAGLSGPVQVRVQRIGAQPLGAIEQWVNITAQALQWTPNPEGPSAPPLDNLRGWALWTERDAPGDSPALGNPNVLPLRLEADSDLRGAGQARMTAHSQPSGPWFLSVDATGLDPVRSDFGEAARPEGLELLGGAFDAHLKVGLADSGSEPEIDTAIRLRGNTLSGIGSSPVSSTAGSKASSPGSASRVAGPTLRDLDGILRLEGERLLSERLTLGLGSTPVRLEEFSASTDGSRVSGRVWIEDLPLNAREFLEWAPGDEWREVLEYGRWRGRLDVQGARMQVRDSGELLIDGPVIAKDVYLEVGLPLQISRARFDLERLRVRDGRVAVDGHATDVYGSLGSRRLAEGGFQLAFSDGELRLRDVSGRLAGGNLGASADGQPSQFSIDMVAPYRYDLRLFGSEFDVDQVVADLFGSALESSGQLDLEVSLFGELEDPFSWWGRGSLALRQARLWSLPVVRELFGALGYEATATFDWMRTRFDLEDGQVYLSDAEAHSPLVRLVGGGRLGLDGTLEQDYDLRYSFVDRFGYFSQVIYWAQSRLVRVSLRGDMGRPRVAVRNPILDVFGGPRASRPSLPLPPATPLPRRF